MYNYVNYLWLGWWWNCQWRLNEPALWPISIDMWAHWSNTDGITRCGMSMATPEATERHHWVTTLPVSPWWQPEQQQIKQRWKLYPICWPFCWPWQCAGTIPHTSPNKGGSGIWWMPLVAATGQVLRPMVAIGCANTGFSKFFHHRLTTKGIKLMSRLLITIGVCHINLMGMSEVRWCDTWLGGVNITE